MPNPLGVKISGTLAKSFGNDSTRLAGQLCGLAMFASCIIIPACPAKSSIPPTQLRQDCATCTEHDLHEAQRLGDCGTLQQ